MMDLVIISLIASASFVAGCMWATTRKQER